MTGQAYNDWRQWHRYDFFWGRGLKYIHDTNYKLLVRHFYFVLTII